MDKIHLVMPMGGGGTRFGNKRFNLPKPLIELQGHPFFYWSTRSIEKYIEIQDITFVVLQEHIEEFRIDQRIKEYYPNANIEVLPKILNGAVLTCCEGTKSIQDNLPILFNDCDHAFLCKSFYDFCLKADFGNVDGGLLTFESDEDKYSYLKFDANGNVIQTIEKIVISNQAICGAYYFKNKKLFLDSIEQYLQKCMYNEFYVSGVYNIMADNGCKIQSFPTDIHITFGTPDEYNIAINDKRLGDLLL